MIFKILISALLFVSVGGLAWLAVEALPGRREWFLARVLEPLRRRLDEVSVSVAGHRLAAMLAGLSLFGGLLFYLALDSALAVPFGLGLGAVLPWAWVGAMEKRKKEKFGTQLLDAVQTLSSALKAGQSLAQAVAFTGKESHEPSASFWRAMARQMQMGQPVEEALERQARDYQGASVQGSLNLLCTAVAVNRSVGGNLAETLDKLAETLRERDRLKGQIQALTAQGRLSGWVVGLLPAGLVAVLWLLDPSMVAPLYTTTAGWVIITIAVVMEAIGALVIRKIVNIEL